MQSAWQLHPLPQLILSLYVLPVLPTGELATARAAAKANTAMVNNHLLMFCLHGVALFDECATGDALSFSSVLAARW